MHSDLNKENLAKGHAQPANVGQVSEPSKDQRELGLRWVESENPVRLFAVAESEPQELESVARSIKTKNERNPHEAGREEIYQVLRNDSAPTIEEKIEYRKLDPNSEDWLWGKGVGNWLPDYKLEGFAIFEDEQVAKDYVEKERELYRKQFGGDFRKSA
jgi:hypothetical protein